MATARVFKSGKSQAVRLPKEFRLRGKEVEIFRRGDELVLREKSKGLGRAFEIIANLPIDCDAIEELKRERPQEPEDCDPGLIMELVYGHSTRVQIRQ